MPAGQPTDGVDLLPFITGKDESKPHASLCWQNRSRLPLNRKGSFNLRPGVHNSAIRSGDWKLVRLNEKIDKKEKKPTWQLYNLAADVGEQRDVASSHPEVVKELSKTFNQWRTSMHPSIE